MPNEPLGIGLIGCGTVGQGVVKLLTEQAEAYAQRVGRPLEVRKVLVRNTSAKRTVDLPADVFTSNPDDLFNDEGIGLVVELAGGLDPIESYIRRALETGRHVVTANKALLARNGRDLFALAHDKDVSIAFEASCGGGIPILNALKFGLAANRVEAVFGILNGTCNFILSQMSEQGASYADALQEAQELGFAEADPTMDVTGGDAAQKLAIIASLAFGVTVHEDAVQVEGIDCLQPDDLNFAAELGYRVKLLAIGRRKDDGIVLRVCPAFVSNDDPMSQVNGSYNALSVYGHAVGHTMFFGHGAGQMPTASAVVGDILNVAGGWYPEAYKAMRLWPDQYAPAVIADTTDVLNRFYLRIEVKDEPGVLARITKVLGDHRISISAVLQHEIEAREYGYVPVIVTTHQASEGAMAEACRQIGELRATLGEPMCIRIMPEG